MRRRVAIVVKGYPRLSETFIANEIRALERRGLDLRIVSLRHPTDRDVHPVHREISAPVLYLPEYLYRQPARVARAWRAARGRPGYRCAAAMFRHDLVRDPTPNRIRRFGQAMVLAAELGDDIDSLHAHFLHTPASVTRYAATMLSLRWSASGHAKDIWTTPDWELREKIRDCDWMVTCSAAAHERLAALAYEPGRISLVYHGLDAIRFPPMAGLRAARDGSDAADPVRILAVGRAVEKKGLDVLLDALARLPAELHWRMTHAGGGGKLSELRRQAGSLGLGDRIDWLGAVPQDRLIDHYRAADLFVLPSRIAEDGDRDGLPNVLMEAQSQSLACIASDVSAVPELITDGVTGVLVPPGDVDKLATAIAALVRNPVRRLGLGREGERRVRAAFVFDDGIDRIAELFGLAKAGEPARCALPSTHR